MERSNVMVLTRVCAYGTCGVACGELHVAATTYVHIRFGSDSSRAWEHCAALQAYARARTGTGAAAVKPRQLQVVRCSSAACALRRLLTLRLTQLSKAVCLPKGSHMAAA